MIVFYTSGVLPTGLLTTKKKKKRKKENDEHFYI